jgi:hypothetical protein
VDGCIEYPKPIGLIQGFESFTGATFFEVAVAQFEFDENENPKDAGFFLEFSIWANGGEGDCDSGDKLDAFFDTDISHLSKSLSSPSG